MEPSREVLRRMGEVEDGEKDKEVIRVSCGRSTRVVRANLTGKILSASLWVGLGYSVKGNSRRSIRTMLPEF